MPLSKQALIHINRILSEAGAAGLSAADLRERSKPFAAMKTRRPLAAPYITYHKGRYYTSGFAPQPPSPDDALRSRMRTPKGRLTAFGAALLELAHTCHRAGPNGLRHEWLSGYTEGTLKGIGTFELNSVGIIRGIGGYECREVIDPSA